MASSCMSIQLKCFALQKKPSVSDDLEYFKTTLSSSAFMPLLMRKVEQVLPMQIDVSKTFKNTSSKVLDFLVDSMFEFVNLSLLPSQSNFGPVDELGGEVVITSSIRGKIPDDFPEGVYSGGSRIFPSRGQCLKDARCAQALHSCTAAQEFAPLGHFIEHLARVNLGGSNGGFQRLQGSIDHPCSSVDPPLGVYIRNGPNPLFGGLKSTKSIFGRSSHIWIEGEGMLHALYFSKDVSDGSWTVRYNNRHVETETFKLEKQRNKPSFLPAIGGDSPAILSAYLLNLLRFGKVNKYLSNTNVFEHSGKFYSIAENHIPQEIDIITLETLGNWDVSGAWNRPFTSHPKRAPGTGELVILGIDAVKPFMEIGVVSADGKELIYKVDLNLDRCSLCHELGVTQRYNVIMDFPLTLDINRLVNGGPLVKYNQEGYARIGVMPRFGDASSIHWFKVEPNCTFHIINSFEDGDEVVVWGCKALDSVIPGPDMSLNQFGWLPRRFKPADPSKENNDDISAEDGKLFSHAYEWRLNMNTGKVMERYLTGKEFSMDFPMINGAFSGVKNRYGYTQVVDSIASSTLGMLKYGGLAKLHFEEPADVSLRNESQLEVETHMFEEKSFCSGAAFVPKQGGLEEDDGWAITFVHNEDTNISQVYVIDTKKFSDEPVAKITLPCRVPYGFHGAFLPMS